MINQFDAVIFDMDGTLIDSMMMWKGIDEDYLERFHISMPNHLQNDIEGMSFTETAIYFKERFNISDTVDKIKADWNTMALEFYTKKVELKAGVMEFLNYLKYLGKPLGIATSNSRQLTTACLEYLKISDLFDAVVTGCDITAGKPQPDIYLENAKLLQVEPKKCFVFEDIPQGLMAAINAGMTTCAVDDEYSSDVKDEKIKLADYYISDFNEFMQKYTSMKGNYYE